MGHFVSPSLPPFLLPELNKVRGQRQEGKEIMDLDSLNLTSFLKKRAVDKSNATHSTLPQSIFSTTQGII